MPGGRPRTFDEEEALDRAVEVFWRQGYEGASLTDLTAAMGVNKPSLYAVYGSKEQLFRRVVGRYTERDMAYARTALAEPTALGVARTLLHENAKALTREDHPPGCLSIQGGLSCGPDNAGVSSFLAASRLTGEQALAERFAAAVAEGDLPAGTDPAALARYVMVVAEGQSVHAAAGVGRGQLQETVEIALRAFPGNRPGHPEPAGG
jgi:AcrR family transcriptional regulator